MSGPPHSFLYCDGPWKCDELDQFTAASECGKWWLTVWVNLAPSRGREGCSLTVDRERLDWVERRLSMPRGRFWGSGIPTDFGDRTRGSVGLVPRGRVAGLFPFPSLLGTLLTFPSLFAFASLQLTLFTFSYSLFLTLDDSTRALLLPYQLPVPTLDLVLRLCSVVPAPGIGGYTLAECLLGMWLCDDFRRNGRVLQVRVDRAEPCEAK